MRQASTRPAALLAALAMWAAACGSAATTGDNPTTGTGNDTPTATTSADSADSGGAAVSSPGAAAASTSSAPAPAPTLTEAEREEMGLEQDPPTAPDIQAENPAPGPEDDHGHGHGDQTHQHDTGNSENSGQADNQTPPATETQTQAETATATTAPAADPPNEDSGQEPPADNPVPEPEPEPVAEPDPEDWQDTAPVIEPVNAPDSNEIRNWNAYTSPADANYVYLSTLLCDPQPGFCNEQNQEYLALICVNPIGQLYSGLRIRELNAPLRNPVTGDLLWNVNFTRVKAIEDHTGNSVGNGRLQYVHVAVDKWRYQYFGETEPAEYAAWRDAFPATEPHSDNNWHSIVEVPGGHARDIGNRITFASQGRPNPCEGEYPGA